MSGTRESRSLDRAGSLNEEPRHPQEWVPPALCHLRPPFDGFAAARRRGLLFTLPTGVSQGSLRLRRRLDEPVDDDRGHHR